MFEPLWIYVLMAVTVFKEVRGLLAAKAGSDAFAGYRRAYSLAAEIAW